MMAIVMAWWTAANEGKVYGETAIPPTESSQSWEYELGLRDSPRFGPDTIWVLNAPGYEFVLFHSGTDKDSTKGCIVVGDQIDLDVSQEVSGATATNTGVNNSPTFSTRKIETKLTLKNGATVLLGGLISDDASQGDAGIPGLKDLPLIGGLFKTLSSNKARRELIVLITPYVINDDHDAESVTTAFRRALSPWASSGSLPEPSAPRPTLSAPLPAPR